MPDLDDQIEDMDPSTVSADDAQQPTPETAAAESAPASSSDATGVTEDDSLLSVVRDVVAERTPADADQAASQAESEEDGQDAPTGEDDDYSDVPFAKHPRFRKVLAERRDFKARAEASEQDATRYQNVQSFMDQNGLGAEEAADLLVIGGLMKTNPVEAWKRAKPTIQKLLQAAGEVLDPELAARVQRGELNQAAALEVSRAQAAQRSMTATRSFEQQRSERQAQQQTASAVTQAATDWETERAAKDPNFAAKLPSLMEKVAYLQRTKGVPNTPEGVRAQLQEAYKAIPAPQVAAAAAPAARPAPKPAITPVRSGAVAGGAAPKQETTMDVLKNVMAKRRSA